MVRPVQPEGITSKDADLLWIGVIGTNFVNFESTFSWHLKLRVTYSYYWIFAKGIYGDGVNSDLWIPLSKDQ